MTNSNESNESNFNLTNPKHNYYLSLIDNEKQIQLSLFICYISISIFTIYNHLGIIIPFFSSTFLYKYSSCFKLFLQHQFQLNQILNESFKIWWFINFKR